MARRIRLTTTRTQDVKGALAVLVLEEQAERRKSPSEIVVELPYVSAKTYEMAREFMARVAPKIRFRLEGRDGSVATAAKASQVRERRIGKPTTAAFGTTLFSSMHKLLLKWLLVGPGEAAHVHTLAALATAAGVSLPTAQRFVASFRAAGHLVVDDDGYRIVRRATLMRRWLASTEAALPSKVYVRSLFNGAEPLFASIAAAGDAGSGQAALGGFAACREHGVLHVRGAMLTEIHVDEEMRNFVRERAIECEQNEADAVLIPTRPVDVPSLFRPLQWRTTKQKVASRILPVDLIQAAVDVSNVPLVGKEQSRFIIDEVLGWRDDD